MTDRTDHHACPADLDGVLSPESVAARQGHLGDLERARAGAGELCRPVRVPARIVADLPAGDPLYALVTLDPDVLGAVLRGAQDQ